MPPKANAPVPDPEVQDLLNLRTAKQAAEGTPREAAAAAAYEAARQAYLSHQAAPYDGHIAGSVAAGQSTLHSMLPVLGSRQSAIDAFATGHVAAGLAYTGLAVFDVVTLGSFAGSTGKAAVEGIGKALGEEGVEQAGTDAAKSAGQDAAAACKDGVNCFVAGTEVLAGDGATWVSGWRPTAAWPTAPTKAASLRPKPAPYRDGEPSP